MSSTTHSDSSRHSAEDHGDAFVVPEPDGVQSGIPFDAAPQPAPARIGAGEPTRARGGDAGTEGRMQARAGMSLRLKLLLSLGLLTLVIVVLGVVATLVLNQISLRGMAELRTHAELAHHSETLVTSIHRMHESEFDLRRGDRDAFEQLQRRQQVVGGDLDQLRTFFGALMHSEGDLDSKMDELAQQLSAYERQTAAYAKARADEDARRADQAGAQRVRAADLQARLDPVQSTLAELGTEYWRRLRSLEDADALGLGLSLSAIERDVWHMAANAQRFLADGNIALAEAARATVTELLARLEVMRGERALRGLRDDLSDVRENLLAYAALLGDAAARMEEERSSDGAQELADAGREIGVLAEDILTTAEGVAASAWRDIEHESEELAVLGSRARWLVGLTAAFGAIIGLMVLITVPRPIMRSIDTLLEGAREIAHGNLTTPVEIQSRDELGQLAATFEQMRVNLMALVQRIQHASVQLSSSINEIQAATTEQASSASQQASAVNQLTSSLNEMSQSASTLLSSSESVGGNVTDIAQTLSESDQSSARILSSMDAIGLSTEQTAERIKSLNDKMDDINEAVATISMVADQTTLLSLNASIEANKAGEMGKGFSVVANEIRRLSDRSIDSAGNINGMVRDIQRATESSALAMDKSSEEIRHGVTLVRESIEGLATINRGMERIEEQMSMILQSTRAQAESSRMVQSTATEMLSSANMVSKAASQTRSVTYELNAMASQLASAVSVFRV